MGCLSKRAYLTVVLVALVASPCLALKEEGPSPCSQLAALGYSFQTQGVRLVPGKGAFYEDDSETFSGQPRLRDVDLYLEPSDNLEALFQILSWGGPLRSDALETLKDHAQSRKPLPLSSLFKEGFPREGGNYAECKGPNCFNAVLLWHQVVSRPTHTSREGFFEGMEGFQELQPGTRLQFGDVFTIESHGKLMHAAIIIDDNIVWHKASKQDGDPYTFETLKGMLLYYHANTPGFEVRCYRKKR